MRKIGLILVLLMIFIVPFAVFADEEGSNNDNKEVKVYFFRGQGCSHCAEAEEWFKSIEEEMGDKFEIVDYETWYNEDNAELMKKVADARGESEQASGVPYIIVGDKSWVGFADDYKEEIKDYINGEYEKDINDRYDVIELLDQIKSSKKDDSSSDVISLIIFLLVVGGIGFGIYKARSNTN